MIQYSSRKNIKYVAHHSAHDVSVFYQHTSLFPLREICLLCLQVTLAAAGIPKPVKANMFRQLR